jgi:hypothetical protein
MAVKRRREEIDPMTLQVGLFASDCPKVECLEWDEAYSDVVKI